MSILDCFLITGFLMRTWPYYLRCPIILQESRWISSNKQLQNVLVMCKYTKRKLQYTVQSTITSCFYQSVSIIKGSVSKSDRMVNDTASMWPYMLPLKRTRIQTIWSAWARERTDAHTHTHAQLYASLPHTDLVRSRTKAEHSCFIQTETKQSSSYLAVSTHTLGPVHLRRGGGRF